MIQVRRILHLILVLTATLLAGLPVARVSAVAAPSIDIGRDWIAVADTSGSLPPMMASPGERHNGSSRSAWGGWRNQTERAAVWMTIDLTAAHAEHHWTAVGNNSGAGDLGTVMEPAGRYLTWIVGIASAADLETATVFLDLPELQQAVTVLSDKFGVMARALYGTVLAGMAELRPLKERRLSTANGDPGVALWEM